MSNVSDIGKHSQSLDDRSQESSKWVAKMDRELSKSETDALKIWLAADPKNESELLQMAKLWDKMDALARLSEVFPHLKEEHRFSAPGRPFQWAIAASFVFASIVGLSIFVTSGSEMLTPNSRLLADVATYETAIGGVSKIKLADGSHITLNTQSRVIVGHSERQRIVQLVRGEMHIDVAHDSTRPLSVIAAGRVVQAIGTAFSVKIDASQTVEVVVDDGRVRIGVHELDSAHFDYLESIDKLDDQSLVVAQGKRVVLDDVSQILELLKPEDIEIRLSWRNGNLIFRGESLAAAVAEVSRYTPVEFVIEEPDLKDLRVAGLFKAGDVSGFLATLETNFNIVYKRSDDATIMLFAEKPTQSEGLK